MLSTKLEVSCSNLSDDRLSAVANDLASAPTAQAPTAPYLPETIYDLDTKLEETLKHANTLK